MNPALTFFAPGLLLTAMFLADLRPEVSRVDPRPAALPKSDVGHPTFLSPHASPIVVGGGRVFVVNTPADTVDVIDSGSRKIVARVAVGVDPVGIALRPDGKELWVTNHVSDSVSVIDTDPASPTYLHVIATVQDFDRRAKATSFDEPVGVAFASDEKAYVALSSENQIAVIDVATREVIDQLDINAQDPRAVVVRGGRLYVLPFESGNQTQLSGGSAPFDGDLVTFDAWEHSVANNNVLSLGAVVDLVTHPRVPDRDLYVFDVDTDELVEVVDSLGTLLYGLAVDSGGRVFIAQTDARNDSNGRTGTQAHGLAEMENRAFLNQITRVDPGGEPGSRAQFFDLEPLPPEDPEPGMALATPFAIEVSADDSTLVVSAAGSDMLFTVDPDSGEVLGRVQVEAVPRGIALEADGDGGPGRAWVLNAVANTVSLVDLSDPTDPDVIARITLEDPTQPEIKRGRMAFNTAAASTTETFSCASCHPDGHTDQLLWVLDTPVVTGGDQIMPRSTMPARGLRDTAPFHWDGIPGDPYGGTNSANIYRGVEPNSDVDEPVTSTRFLVDDGLASTMRDIDAPGPEEGELTEAERDDLAKFLLSVAYPPAQRRAYDNVLSSRAQDGFRLFHIDGDLDPTKPRPNVCGDCHRMPFLVSTNTPGTGMDAPTWRGAYDRWLILPQGRLNIIDFDFYRNVAEAGAPEREVWRFSWAGRRRFDPVWDMVLEGSTGFSGSFARQVTLNQDTAGERLTRDLMGALELSASEGGVVLQAEGVFLDGEKPRPVELEFSARTRGGTYVARGSRRERYTRDELVTLASAGHFVGTFTARHGAKTDLEHPQPALWTLGPIESQRGHQDFPVLYPGSESMVISGRHLRRGAQLIVDGRLAEGKLSWKGERVEVKLKSLPPVGLHFLQVQNPQGQFSNDFIFRVTQDEQSAEAVATALVIDRSAPGQALVGWIARGDLERIKTMVAAGVDLNARQAPDGSTPLSSAAFHGQARIVEYLIEQGADVAGTNRDGNTPLHVAAFMCELEIVETLLEAGASVAVRSNRGETPIDVVSGEWNSGLAGFYTSLGDSSGRSLDLERIQRDRPRLAELLRKHARSDR